ncbi:MAG TPA: zinc ABC transporter substrate-binding protein [Pseudolabrys sp.]|nr:zinc ABC transporter substrate-binding protein [Pseudolabrys sp.]
MAASLALLVAFCIGGHSLSRAEERIAVIAAENFYGDIVRQIGGDRVSVASILSRPDQDPHFFEAAPSVARRIDEARLIVSNGAGYDGWMDKLIAASSRKNRMIISAAAEVGHKPGDNPHIWYNPAAMPVVTTAIAEALMRSDPSHADEYTKRLKATLGSLSRISRRVAELRMRYAGIAVTATEPVFGPMADALGLAMRNQRFQLAVMNNTEPSARDMAGIENDLKGRKVRVLIYNAQVSSKTGERLRALATHYNIPTVGVTETMPPHLSFQDWQLRQLDALELALGRPGS